MSAPLEQLPPGYRVGNWEVGERIASGGWGTVYEGRPASHGDREPGTWSGDGQEDVVALKFLPTTGLAPRQARALVETARRETEFGRRARHPRLIRMLDSVVLSEPGDPVLDGAVVLIMERAEHSLRQFLAQDGPGPTEFEKSRLLTEICEGLAHLHGSGWVHGDLKPDNVLIMADGSARLSDFGLAVELDGTQGTHGYMPPLGTPDYLPPERWRAPLGERGVQVRPSHDVWALGIMIHQMFAGGTSPFPGATPMARAAAVQEYAEGRAPLRLDNALPPFWRDLAADCLAPTHAERAVHTAESLLARMRTASVPRPGGRHRPLLGVAVAAALCGVAAAGWTYAADGNGSEEQEADEPVARVAVFNVEKLCRDRAEDRLPACSLGLAMDPARPYTIENVVATRVWHDDVLSVDCHLPQGTAITDEIGTRSAGWFRVRLPDEEPGRTAWLPAVRTKDRPVLPECS